MAEQPGIQAPQRDQDHFRPQLGIVEIGHALERDTEGDDQQAGKPQMELAVQDQRPDQSPFRRHPPQTAQCQEDSGERREQGGQVIENRQGDEEFHDRSAGNMRNHDSIRLP
ncbi:hypothetical protein SDC9_203528 [bioreactor metagenome]|uniref:Uncharacterized protein n=1 Tax=bioreactor metagenome TaxID=1076179 RepID=A0A645J5U4_9ZZZZ